MRSNRLVLAAAAGLATCFVPAPPAFAQEHQPDAVHAADHEPDLINIDFQGGTMAEFVEAMRQTVQPGDVNVILRGGADAIAVPAVRLRNVTIESAFDAICPREQASINMVQKMGAPIYVIEGRHTRSPFEQGPDAAPASHVIYDEFGGKMPAVLRIYSVKEIVTGDVPLQGIMDAVKTALSVQGEEPQPELLFHEDSGVLIVRGTEGQHVVVNDLLKTLERDAERARGLAERESAMSLVTQDRIRGMKAEIEQTQLELDLKRAQMAEIEQAAQQGLISQNEMHEAETELKQTELRIRHMQAELEAARQSAEHSRRVEGVQNTPLSHAESTISIDNPDIARKLLTVIAEVTNMGGNTRITGVDVKDGKLVVRYSGTPEGVDHLRALCVLVEELGRGG